MSFLHGLRLVVDGVIVGKERRDQLGELMSGCIARDLFKLDDGAELFERSHTVAEERDECAIDRRTIMRIRY